MPDKSGPDDKKTEPRRFISEKINSGFRPRLTCPSPHPMIDQGIFEGGGGSGGIERFSPAFKQQICVYALFA